MNNWQHICCRAAYIQTDQVRVDIYNNDRAYHGEQAQHMYIHHMCIYIHTAHGAQARVSNNHVNGGPKWDTTDEAVFLLLILMLYMRALQTSHTISCSWLQLCACFVSVHDSGTCVCVSNQEEWSAMRVCCAHAGGAHSYASAHLIWWYSSY